MQLRLYNISLRISASKDNISTFTEETLVLTYVSTWYKQQWKLLKLHVTLRIYIVLILSIITSQYIKMHKTFNSGDEHYWVQKYCNRFRVINLILVSKILKIDIYHLMNDSKGIFYQTTRRYWVHAIHVGLQQLYGKDAWLLITYITLSIFRFVTSAVSNNG